MFYYVGASVPEPAAPASCRPAAELDTICPRSSEKKKKRGNSRLVTHAVSYS